LAILRQRAQNLLFPPHVRLHKIPTLSTKVKTSSLFVKTSPLFIKTSPLFLQTATMFQLCT
jgi:hypothetical protein